MKSAEQFFELLHQKLKDGQDSQMQNLETAADWIVESHNSKGNFYVFGSGHSHMIAEELYTRAGGLDFVKAILPPELMLHEMMHKSTNLERLPGYAKALLDLYPVDEKDVFLIISNSGRNSVPVEMAMEAKKRGAKVIALTSLRHSTQVESRQIDGKKLYEVADLVLDNQAELGDASFHLEKVEAPIGGISDFMGIALVQTMVVMIADKMVHNNQAAPILYSANAEAKKK